MKPSRKQLVIVGAGGFGRDVIAWARQSGWCGAVRGFIDDNPSVLSRFTKDVPLLGSVAEYNPRDDEVFVCAIGQVEAKRACVERILSRGGEFTQIVHPSAMLGEDVRLGLGVIVCPFAVLASDVQLGDFVTVNFHSSLGHDAVVGDWTQLHCHVDITGAAVVGQSVTLGSHASILPGIRVGNGAVVGAGAIVTRDVPAGAVVYGVPAKEHGMRATYALTEQARSTTDIFPDDSR